MQVLNYILTIAVIAVVALLIRRYLTSTKGIKDAAVQDVIEIEKPTIEKLVKITANSLNSILREDLTNQNLSKVEFDSKTAAKARIRKAEADAAYGDKEAKEIIKAYIQSIITTNDELRVGEENICQFIPFDNKDELSPQDKFFCMLQGYEKIYEKDGFSHMFKEFGWGDKDLITDEMVEEMYDICLDEAACEARGIQPHIIPNEYNDWLEYLVQEIFQRYEGFGSADRLFEANIDEIDGGVSGIPAGSFELSNDFVKNARYSYESIWVLFHGHNIHLECLSFGTEEELERVCDNVYKYNAQRVFSRSAGYVVSSMKDGSRVVVVRPPFADKFAFFVRKFDSAPSIAPEDLINGEGAEIPLILSKWFVKGQRNIAITGQQGTGKTTLLKAYMRWIENLNIRTQELAFEMNLSFSYPDKNITSFQETDSVSAQEGLNVQKKTNGAVNIVGEVANAEQASHIIQTANVASLFAMFTHHAKRTSSLVEMIALNLLQMGLYKEKRDAVEISANTLNIDVHLENTDGYRHIERICEIIPISGQLYPSEILQREHKERTGEDLPYTEEMARLDEREFYIRQTDRRLFDVNEIVRYNRIPGSKNPREGYFSLVNMPSQPMIDEIRSRLTDPQLKEEFDMDLEKVQKINEKVLSRHAG